MIDRQVDYLDTEKLRTTFTIDGVDTDPDAVSLKLRSPDGVVTTYLYPDEGVSKEALGIFFRDHTFNQQGVWRGQFIGTYPTGTTTEPVRVEVRRTDAV